MRHQNEIARQEASMAMLANLTGALLGVARTRITQAKEDIVQSSKFFDELWQIYVQLRGDSPFSFGRDSDSSEVSDKELYILITSEGEVSNDIDQKLMNLMLESYDQEKNDIIVIGHHGAVQLAQISVVFKKYFKLPVNDQNINVAPIINEVEQYKSTKVYYQEYISLTVQDVKRIELSSAVLEQGKNSGKPDDVISEKTYSLEPSSGLVISQLERSMMQIVISQLILNSKLAQYAGRLRAMGVSHERAHKEKVDLHTAYNRVLRSIKDDRLKEAINATKKNRAGAVV